MKRKIKKIFIWKKKNPRESLQRSCLNFVKANVLVFQLEKMGYQGLTFIL